MSLQPHISGASSFLGKQIFIILKATPKKINKGRKTTTKDDINIPFTEYN